MQLKIILRNIFSNWLGYAVTALVGLVLSPFIVSRLGNTGYGLWTLILSLTGYFGLLDLGIRSTVGRYVARHLALADHRSVNRTVSTAFTVLGAGGLLAFAATLVVHQFFFDSFNIEAGYQQAGRMTLLIAGFTIACALPMGVFSAVLIALERFDVVSGVGIASALTRGALVVAFLSFGHGIVSLALISLGVTLAEYAVMRRFARALHPPLELRPAHVTGGTARELFGFGIFRFAWISANQVIFHTDAVVIGIFLDAGAITYYAIAGSLVNYGRNFVSLLSDTFYPAATRLDARRDVAGLRDLLILGTRMTLLVSLPLLVGLIFLGEQFITLWMGKDYVYSATILAVLVIPQFTSTSQYVSSLVLAGMARHRLLAYLALAEGAANLVLSIILVQRIGLIGVAWGTVIPHLVTTGIVIPIYTLRILKLPLGRYFMQAAFRPLICVVPFAAIVYGFSVTVEGVTWSIFAGEVISASLFFAVLGYLLCLDESQRAALHRQVHRILNREAKPA